MLKRERVNRRFYQSRTDARADIFDYIEGFYIPALAEFRARHPLVSLDLRLSDEVLDLVEGAYDLIIRNAPLADSTLVARKLALDQRLLVASADYIEQYGFPSSPEKLTEHRCVILADYNKWKFMPGQSVSASRSIVVDDGEPVRTLSESGMGNGIQSLWIASEQLKSGRLVRVLSAHPLATEYAIWALYPSNRTVATKVRAMIDFLLDRFQPTPPRER